MQNTEKLPAFSKAEPYTIPVESYRDGFRAFQKHFILRRNYIMMVVFLILLVSFVVSAAQDPTNKLSYILGMVCMAAIFMLWYNPHKQRSVVMDVARDMTGVLYTAECDGKVLRIQTVQEPMEEAEEPEPDADAEEQAAPIPESRIALETAWIQAFETFYLVCDGKRMFYILPKNVMTQAAEEAPRLEQTETPAETAE